MATIKEKDTAPEGAVKVKVFNKNAKPLRRAGLVLPAGEWTEHTVTAAQLSQLQADSGLSVQVI
jgi:hypothetical protein